MGLNALPVETSLSSQYIDATTHDPAWIRSREFSLETLGMGSTESRPPSARRRLACVSFRATHRTIFLDSISFITLICQPFCASSASGGPTADRERGAPICFLSATNEAVL